MSVPANIRPPSELYLSDPQRTKLGRAILAGSIDLLNRLGLENFTFKKLSVEIGSTEASMYRYFGNKNKLLLYLTSWYWAWVDHLMQHTASHERNPLAKLRAAVHTLTHPYDEQSGPDYIDQRGLHRLVINEGSKAYRNKLVDRKHSHGLYLAYHKLIEQLSRLISGASPGFEYPRALASSVFEMVHDHPFFARHLPRLTDIGVGSDMADELEAMIWSWTQKLLGRTRPLNDHAGLIPPFTVFVTRTLAPNSPLRRWAVRTGNLVCGRSLLDFRPVSFTPPERVDWWFFYSPRAVEFGLAEGLPHPDVRLAALGEGTAETLRTLAGRVDFTGRGAPGLVARQFLKVADGKRVFFPRAKYSRRSLQRELKDRIVALEAICYTNEHAANIKPIRADVIVFTSPRNVNAYLDRYALPDDARLIAIGGVTAAALYQRGYAGPFPESPSEAAIADILDKHYVSDPYNPSS